eukprot:scaffold273_cov127-Isochrysis_galbana.AAC.3
MAARSQPPDVWRAATPSAQWHAPRLRLWRRRCPAATDRASACKCRGVAGWGGGRHVAKVLTRQVHHLVVVDAARRGQHHAGGCVVRLDVACDVVGGDGVDVLDRAEDGARERRAHDDVALPVNGILRLRAGRGTLGLQVVKDGPGQEARGGISARTSVHLRSRHRRAVLTGANVEFSRMSESSSMAFGTSCFMTLA